MFFSKPNLDADKDNEFCPVLVDDVVGYCREEDEDRRTVLI